MSKTLELIDRTDAEGIIREVVREEVRRALEPLMMAIVIQQKDAAQLADVSPRTVSARITDGEIEVLTRPGSRLNYMTLRTVEELRPRRKRAK